MVDYSLQKPIQNPSYFKKPATKSQLTAGGNGGQGAALAANVNGASGQANQGTSMFSPGVLRVGGQASFPEPLAPNKLFGPQSELATTFQKGGITGIVGQGAQNLYKDVSGTASRLGGSLAAGTKGILFGKEEGLQQLAGTNQPTSVSITPSVTTKPTISTVDPTQSNATKTALGQFTTPTGGFANVSISPNQSANIKGMSLKQLTPDQQSYLQGQIDRNARPEVQAEFAKQAAIVKERLDRSAEWDAANDPNSPENRAIQSRNLFLNAMQNNNLAGIQEYGDLYKKEAGIAGDITQNRLTAGSAAAQEAQKLGYGAEATRQANELNIAKANVEDTANWQKLITSPEAAMIPKSQLVNMALQRNQPLSLEYALGEDIAKQVREESDPVAKKTLVRSVLGDLTDLYINSQRSQ
jgi:hypothetical protein